MGTAIAIAAVLLSTYLPSLKKVFGVGPEATPTPVASSTPVAGPSPAATAGLITRQCPDPLIVSDDWMKAAGPSTFQVIERPFVARCVLATARALGPRVEEGFFGRPGAPETSYRWVSAVLRANGMVVNPLRCNLDCLRAGLPDARRRAPGMIAVLVKDESVGFELGYEGDILRIAPSGTLLDSPVAIKRTLQLPYDSDPLPTTD